MNLTYAWIFRVFVATLMVWPHEWAMAQQLKIQEPTAKSEHAREVDVKGSVSPPTSFVWILARRKDFAPLWWPQREAEVDRLSGDWRSSAVLGGPQDVGHDFDIGVAVMDADGHAKLKKYWLNAMQTGAWSPIEIPTPLKITVIPVRKKN